MQQFVSGKSTVRKCRLCERELDPNNPNPICLICVQKLTDTIALPYCYNVEEVRTILRLDSQEQVRRMVRESKLPAVRKGKSYLFPKDDFDAWLKSGRPALSGKETGEVGNGAISLPMTYGRRAGVTRTTSEIYEETEHKQKIRELARELQSAITLPWVIDSFLLDLKPGRFLLGREGFPINIAKDGRIHVQSNLEGEDQLTHLWQGLRSHLQTGGFPSVLDDIRVWKEGVADNLVECYKLLWFLRRKLVRTFKTSIPPDYHGEPGFIVWFPITILADAVEQAQGSTHFRNFPYQREGLALRFGAWLIYQGVEDQDLKLYEDTHRELRSRCSTWKQTKKIAKQRQELYRTVAKIKEQLGKFIDMEHVLGQCELCSLSHL